MELELVREAVDVGVTRIRLLGALDLLSKPTVLDAGLRALDESSGLVLNLAAVEFMDSSGLGALIELSREAEERGKTYVVEEPSPRVARILTVTGMLDAWN